MIRKTYKKKTVMSGRVKPSRQISDGSEVILLACILIVLSFIFN